MTLTNLDYKLILTGIFDDDVSNPFENQFWYKAAGGGGSAQDLAQVFVAQVVPQLALIVTSKLEFVQLEVLNMVNMQDFTTATFGIPGERGTNVQNRESAWGFQYLRPIRGMHNGSKRIGPIALGDVVNDAPITAILVTLDAVSDILQTVIASANTDVDYQPCCVKTVKVQNASNEGFHYEPDTLLVCNSVSFTRPTHQDSRTG